MIGIVACSWVVCFNVFFAILLSSIYILPHTMLPTTRATASKAAQKQVKRTAMEHDQLQKAHMVTAVNNAILEYSTSTGKSVESAQQELFTIENLTKPKRTLCARDIFVQDRMHEINKGMCLEYHLHYTGI